MMARIIDLAEAVVIRLMAAAFAALIAVVAIQVLARNVAAMPVIWTLDVAQLLFSWCIFLGAGVAFRRGAHYVVNLWPVTGPLSLIPAVASFVASAIVVVVLVRNGIDMAEIMTRRQSQTLGISLTWYFAPIPICGALIGMALIEQVEILLRRRTGT
jgi:TRAP-type C4-dicarboxylate transport system permease small subunit